MDDNRALGQQTVCWKMIRRRDWQDDNGSVIAPGSPVPTPDRDLEVFDVVDLEAVLAALEDGYHPQNPSPLHPADYVRQWFAALGQKHTVGS